MVLGGSLHWIFQVSTLSSALSSIKNNMTSVAYSIRKVIDRLKE